MAYTAPPRDSAAVCSVPNTERLEQMLDEAGFALLVLTAESERTDGVVLARQNVVHEAGLFQGRLGWRKAIVLREDGCEEFSNIAGLGQIPFPNAAVTVPTDRAGFNLSGRRDSTSPMLKQFGWSETNAGGPGWRASAAAQRANRGPPAFSFLSWLPTESLARIQ